MKQSFEQLGVSSAWAAALAQQGITVPTPIQTEVLPLALVGRDVVGRSATGTGKTLAYLLPLLHKIDTARREMQAIILAPTHELAVQILRQIELLAGAAAVPVTATALIGSANITRQIEKLKEKPHILVGSSGRMVELMQKKKINAQTIKTIVLDEADRLLDEQNLNTVMAVIKATQRDRQLLLFSATMVPKVLEQAKMLLQNPAMIALEGRPQVAAAVTHLSFTCELRDKMELLRKLVHHLGVQRGLVFINQSDAIETTTAKLAYHGLAVAGLSGAAGKAERKAALEAFRRGKAKLLVASDIAARGLDITDVDFVFHLELPEEAELYLHRVGRTGRAGKSGTSVALATRAESRLLELYEKKLKLQIEAKYLARGKVLPSKRR